LPIFRLSKAFDVGRNAKVFLNLQGGLTRGAVPDLKRQEEQTESLRHERRRNEKQRIKLEEQQREIFQLRNELDAINGLVEDDQDVPLAPQVSGKPEIGALPDFVVIGAMRCGTSQFYNFLTQHPNVEPPAKKEVHYFDRPKHLDQGIEWYRRCFPQPKWNDGQRSITGEATPNYLFNPSVPKRMAAVIPHARLIVLMRNPVDRAYSHYHLQVRRGRETRSFEEAVEAEQARLLRKAGKTPEDEDRAGADQIRSSYLSRGVYVDQLRRWSKFFDDEQMLVLKSEDFFKRTTDTMKLVQDFLGLPYREPELQRRGTKYDYEPMDPTIRQRLEAFFEPHNRRLYEYLGVDFGW
jgi:hypothetical protein